MKSVFRTTTLSYILTWFSRGFSTFWGMNQTWRLFFTLSVIVLCVVTDVCLFILEVRGQYLSKIADKDKWTKPECHRKWQTVKSEVRQDGLISVSVLLWRQDYAVRLRCCLIGSWAVEDYGYFWGDGGTSICSRRHTWTWTRRRCLS